VACAAVVVVLVALTAGLAFAGNAGKLDRSFGGDGKVVLKDLTGYAESVQVGNHHRIVAAGFAGNQWGPGAKIAVARLRPDGRLDRSFSHNGIRTRQFNNLARANDVAVTRRGGIIVVGETCVSKQDCEAAVVRFTRNGGLKQSFGDHGREAIDFEHGPGVDSANAVEIDPKGRIVIAGSGCVTGVPSCDVVITRLSPNGAIDRDFTGGAKAVYTSFKSRSGRCPDSGGAASMALNHYGEPVVVGTCDGQDVGLVRLRTVGRIDRNFGDHGKVRADLGFVDGAEDVDINPFGRIAVSGAIHQRGFAVAKFNRSGGLDRAFGNDGTATADVGAAGSELAIDSHNRIVVAGGPFTFTVARFKAGGHLDRSFGRHGHMTVGRDLGYGYALGVTTDNQDRVVASGFKQRRFALVRLQG
jgi:uncharacterized delta-60 repeat protein